MLLIKKYVLLISLKTKQLKALKHLNKYFLKYKWRLLIGLFISVLSKLLLLEIPQIIKNSLNVVQQYNTNHLLEISEVKSILFKNILIIIGVTLLGGFFTFLMRQTIIVSSRLIEFDLKNEIYEQYQRLSLNFYKKNRTGDLMSRISEDVSKVRMYAGPAMMYALNMLISFIIGFYHMFSISAKLTFYTMLPFPILSLAIFILSRQINKKSTVVQQYLSKLNSFNQEYFSGINIIKSYGLEDNSIQRFVELANDAKEKNIALAKVQALFFPFMILLIGLSNVIVIYVGGQQVIHNEIEIGVVGAFVMYINILTWPVASVGWIASIVQQAESSQKRINDFLKETPEIVNTATKPSVIKGDIRFENVSLQYDDTNITALKNINFSIKKGETLGILGKTGAGKSSIINLITRLYDCTEGTIFIDDTPIKDCNLNDLRKHIAVVPQDAFLFSDTIANNIKFGNEKATFDEIVQASKDADIHDNIMSFKKQYDTVLGERGVTLSGGQKQRTAIARAFIKKSTILILDDCLSAVDIKTEEKILKNIKKISADKTTIIISHRISSVKNTDKILILDKGTLVSQGTHEQLIREKGFYQDLYFKQILKKEN